MRDLTKAFLGGAVCVADPQCRFDRAVFILAHMRCGSTALSNVLCSRPEISGYGEAHVAYRSQADLGRLVVNQALRRAWKPRARFVFDKILHSRHDAAAPGDFFRSRAVFLCRDPDHAIPSIRRLFAGLDKSDYATETEAAAYYVERVTRLSALWRGFPPENRVGFTHEALVSEPDVCLRQVTALLGLRPGLRNTYRSHAASIRGGGGDPTTSSGLKRIVAPPATAGASTPLAIDPVLRRRAQEAFAQFAELAGLGRPSDARSLGAAAS